MARTISQIYNSMVAEKQTFSSLSGLTPTVDDSQTLLTDLTSASKVAIWRLIFWIGAFTIWTHESLWDVFREEVTATAESLIPGTAIWYRDQALAYQDGYNLTYNETTKKYEYETVDTDAQIIVQAAVIEANGVVYVKVAKSDGGTGLEELTSGEKEAFETYLNQIRFAGTQTSVISEAADLMKVLVEVWVDNTVIYNDETNPSDTDNGSLVSDKGTTYPIRDAINTYLGELDFNGVFYTAKLIDAIQSVEGVNNIVVSTLEAKYGAFDYSDVLAMSGQKYQANAGYIEIDETSFPLSDTITYYNGV